MKGKIKDFLRSLWRFKELPYLLFSYHNDMVRWVRYSLSFNKDSRSHAQAELLLLLHSLEKGLSFKTVKNGFGKEKGEGLYRLCSSYLERYGVDEVSLMAMGVLDVFYKHPKSGKNENFGYRLELLKSEYKINDDNLVGGLRQIDKHYIDFNLNFADLYAFAASRHSVRDFSLVDIKDDEINLALQYAVTAPSVCNRQTSRLHIFQGDILDKILETQLGNQGWAHKANKLFVISSDLNFFGSTYERNQAFIDGGMFAMQFVMGLHAQRIASCCKMYIRTPKLDKMFYNITKIPSNEVPIMLVLAGHYSDDTISVPYSNRLAINVDLEKIKKIH